MELEFCKDFIKIVETGSYSTAAELRFITQSAISKHIKQLEETLGCSLFERTGRNMKLTEAGKSFYPLAREFVNVEKKTHEQLRCFRNPEKNILRISCFEDDTQYRLLPLITRFLQETPCNLSILNYRYSWVFDKLRNGLCDLAFVKYQEISPSLPTDMQVIPYKDAFLRIICLPDHPLADRQIVRLTEAAKHRLLIPNDRSFFYQLITQAFESAGVPINALDTVTVGGAQAMVHCTLENMGLGFRWSNISEIDPMGQQFRQLQTDPVISCKIGLAYCKKRPLSCQAKDFIQYFLRVTG